MKKGKGGNKMKNKKVNQKVLKAISIGLSAMMAVTPMTAMAAEGENTGNPEGENLEADSNVGTAEVEVSETSKENQSEVMENLTEVKDEYSSAGEEAETESEAGNYAEVAGNVSDILSDIEELNKANDNAAADKETFEEKTDDAQKAVEAADEALEDAEGTSPGRSGEFPHGDFSIFEETAPEGRERGIQNGLHQDIRSLRLRDHRRRRREGPR